MFSTPIPNETKPLYCITITIATMCLYTMCTGDIPLMGISLYRDIQKIPAISRDVVWLERLHETVWLALHADAPRWAQCNNPTTHAHYTQNIKTHTLRALIKRLSARIHSIKSVNVHNGKESHHLFIKPVNLRESV